MGTTFKTALFVVSFAVTYRLLFSKSFDPSVIKGQRVLITGGSSGIGEELAYQYASYGASVFITARRENLLQQVIAKCKELGSPEAKFGYYTMDIADLSQSQKLVEIAATTLGGLDVLVLNHAIIPDMMPFSAEEELLKAFSNALHVNTLGSAHIAAHALPHLRESHGSIGFIGSVIGKVPFKLVAPYAVSKAGIAMLSAILRAELRSDNISVTHCVIGLIGTETAKRYVDVGWKKYSSIYTAPQEDLKFENVSDAAEAILEGVSSRAQEISFPQYWSIGVKILNLLTGLDYDIV